MVLLTGCKKFTDAYIVAPVHISQTSLSCRAKHTMEALSTILQQTKAKINLNTIGRAATPILKQYFGNWFPGAGRKIGCLPDESRRFFIVNLLRPFVGR